MSDKAAKKKIAVVGDLHVKENDSGQWTDYFREISGEADVLALCGDLTDTGRTHEAEILANELRACSIPVVTVLGNHDFEHDEAPAIAEILAQAKVQMLEGESVEVCGIGIAGIKGFGGGFGKRMLSMFGEKEIKDFVQTAVDEELRLESALSRLESEHAGLPKIVIMHYAPVSDTVVGEPEQIWPFLGCSRLVQPIDKYNLNAVFHGHAHMGALRGKTPSGIPVFNVSYPILLREGIKRGFYLFEI